VEYNNLVKRAINGDGEAFELLIKQESDKLYKIAFLHVRNKEDALDVIQESVYKAFISIEKLKNPDFFSTWLVKILIRTAYRVLEQRKVLAFIDDDSITDLLDKEVPEYEQQVDLSYAVSKLKNNYQTVIILFYYNDLSIRDISKTLDKPEGTIKTYLRRARLELKKMIGEDYYEQRMV
jgi:RNA polymerase sigma-70 factor (ECF subfamily)